MSQHFVDRNYLASQQNASDGDDGLHVCELKMMVLPSGLFA